MPMDGICMQAVAEELRSELLGLRIDKVQQPARDQVILLLRGNKRLLLNAGANTPRIQLTALTRDNPAEPPMFCMLLRKHLVGGRVAAVTQPPLERLVRLELDVTDDFGQPGRRTLVLEAMGRRVQPDPTGWGGPDHRLPPSGGRGHVCCPAGAAGAVL